MSVQYGFNWVVSACFINLLIIQNVFCTQKYCLCVDDKCSEPISLAKPLLNYASSVSGVVSFERNDKIYIYSKPVPEEKRIGYFEVDVYDKSEKLRKARGLAPPKFLQESKKFVKTSDLKRVVCNFTNRSSKKKTDQAKKELPANVIDSSPPKQSVEVPVPDLIEKKILKETSPTREHEVSKEIFTPTVTATANRVVGGVNAEVGDAGPPSTPYEVVDGTTLHMGTDGEVTIVTTSTQPPTFKTDAPPNPSQQDSTKHLNTDPNPTATIPISQVLETEIVDGNEGDNDEEDDEEEEDDDEDDASEEANFKSREEENVADSNDHLGIIPQTHSEEITPTPSQIDLTLDASSPSNADLSKTNDLLTSNDNLGNNREKSEQVEPVASKKMQSLHDVHKSIEEALRTEPGLSLEFDEKILLSYKGSVSVEKSSGPNLHTTTLSDDSASNDEVKIEESVFPEPIAITDEIISTDSTVTVEATGMSDGNDLLGQTVIDEIPDNATHSEIGPIHQISGTVNGSTLIDESRAQNEMSKNKDPTDSHLPEVLNSGIEKSNFQHDVLESEKVSVFSRKILSEDSEFVKPKDDGDSFSDSNDTESVISENHRPDQIIPVANELPSVHSYTNDPVEPISQEPARPDELSFFNTEPPSVLSDSSHAVDRVPQVPLDTDGTFHTTVDSLVTSNTNSPASTAPQGTLFPIEPLPLATDPTSDSNDSVNSVSTEFLKEPSLPVNNEGGGSVDSFSDSAEVVAPQITDAVSDETIGSSFAWKQDESSSEPPKAPQYNADFSVPPPMYPGLVPKSEAHAGIDQQPADVQSSSDLRRSHEDNLIIETSTEHLEVSEQSTVASPDSEAGASTGIFSFIYNMFDSPGDILGEQVASAAVNEPDEISKFLPTSHSMEGNEIIEGECKTLRGLESDCTDEPGPAHLWHVFEKNVPESSYTLLYLVVTSITILIFTLGYYFIEGSRQSRPLIAKINQLTHDLQVSMSQLEARQLQADVTSATQVNNQLDELNQLREENAELQAQVEALQQELDNSADAGMELNKMVTDLLTEKRTDPALLQTMENLQAQLDTQQRVIDDMNRKLQEKVQENKTLQEELTIAHEKLENSEEELSNVRENFQQHIKEKESSLFELDTKYDALEKENVNLEANISALSEIKAREIAVLSKSISDLTEQLAVKETEYCALSDIVQDLKQGGVDIAAVYDAGHIKAELARLTVENDSLQERIRDEEGARKLLENHVQSVDEEVVKLRTSYEQAEKEKSEAETKLTVLSNYWKEKETHFQKELGLQEAMWAQKQGAESSAYDKIKSLQDEIDSYNFDQSQNRNWLASATDSLSSNFTDLISSSNSSKQHDIVSSPESSSLCSLPAVPCKTHSSPRLLRRKSSSSFEARLEHVERALKTSSTISLSEQVPDDLLKLQELKTVRASPFRDISASPKVTRNLNNLKKNHDTSMSVSEMLTSDDRPEYNNEVLIKENIPKPESFNVVGDDSGIMKFGPPSISTPVLLDLPLIPVPSVHNFSNSESKYTDCEGSEPFIKGCELSSSATLEFDIKVVANASAGVKKFTMKTAGEREEHRSQNETLKKEIVDQERGLKNQIATLEKKAHENWVAARQAERRLDESKQEAGQLRNMLTLIDKTASESASTANSSAPRGELNGETPGILPLLPDGSSPHPMPPLPFHPLGPPPLLPPNFMAGMPPFLPPPHLPPPPLLPGDRRLPPLGRMSSPPLNRFSPSPGDYGYDRISPPLLSPPARNYRSPATHRSSPWEDPPPPPYRSGFRPVAGHRDLRRDQGSHESSGHSSEESMEKLRSPRRGGK